MEPVYLKAPVRALIYLNDTLIWGEGDLLHFGDEIIRIPGLERIIGLDSGSNDSIFIRTEFNLFKYQAKVLIRIPLITRDRIMAVLDEGDKLWVVQARGTVQLFTCSSNVFTYSKSFSLSEYSAVFYSASIIRRFDIIEIAYGTIFSGILLAHIHEQSDNKIRSIGMINGHRGTIFDIKHHPTDQNILISCSDDRSVRIWKRNSEMGGKFESSAVCNGHEARVWSVNVRDDIIASVSEDSTCRIWDLDGKLIKVIEGDSNSKSLWSVALNNNADMVAIGSNDSCVISHNLNSRSKTPPSDLIDYSLPESFGSIKNIIISNEGICYAATDKDKLVKIQGSHNIEIKGINKFPAMAVNSHSLFIANEDGVVFCHNLMSDEFKFEELFTLNKKITKIHAQDNVLFLETVNCEYYLYSLVTCELKGIGIDKKHKITSFCEFKDQIFIGTRQGVLLVYQADLLVKSLQLTHQESLKSIIITSDGFISVLDRSGYEIILDLYGLTVLHRNKIGGKGILEEHINDKFISSFYQQYFIVNSPVLGVIDKVFCGGGHRLWSASSDSKYFHFAFMSNGKLTIRHGSLENIKIISSKSHGKEIRCSHNLKDNLILSGSEDGLLILYDGLNYRNQLRLSNTSIKCITSIDDLVFVGGSNETIEAFNMNKTFLNHVGSCPKQIKSIETRVLCLDSIKFNDKVLILAGYSDASIRLFEYQTDPNDQKFVLKATAEKVHQNRCVQQIRFLSGFKFISAGADGLIQSWILQDDGQLTMTWHCCVHQSGINAIDIKSHDNNVFILTGGEDGSISLLTVSNDEIKTLTTKNVHNSTVTGVKFLKNDEFDDSFISASIDRYIYIHKNDNLKGFRTVISDISAISITSDNLFSVYGAGIEAFKL